METGQCRRTLNWAAEKWQQGNENMKPSAVAANRLQSGAIMSVCLQEWIMVEVAAGVWDCIQPASLQKLCVGLPR